MARPLRVPPKAQVRKNATFVTMPPRMPSPGKAHGGSPDIRQTNELPSGRNDPMRIFRSRGQLSRKVVMRK